MSHQQHLVQLAVLLLLLPAENLVIWLLLVLMSNAPLLYRWTHRRLQLSNMFVAKTSEQVAAMVVNDSAIRKAYDRIGWYCKY